MQLVSREVLFDVMKDKKPVEWRQGFNESEMKAFQTFVKKTNDEFRLAKSKHQQFAKKSKNPPTEMELFTNAMLRFMNDNKNDVRFVGQGSSRIVFALVDGTALKLAKTLAGIAQNRQEAKTCMNPMVHYAIFPDFYGADTKNWLALNCELCAKATTKDFKETFMAQPIAISNVIEMILKMDIADNQLDQLLDFYKQQENYACAFIVKHLIEGKTEADKALKSLLDFYRTHGESELLLGDVEAVENWGITIRNGQKVLVIIDAGFNAQVFDDFYSNKKFLANYGK